MSKTARDVMTKNIIVVEEDATINKMIEILLENKISCAPVVNKKKELVGIVTKTDILGHLLDLDIDFTLHVNLKDVLKRSSEHGDSEISSVTNLKVSDIMTRNPITAEENTNVELLATIMIDHNIHRLIIIKDSDIIGIVSTIDLLYHVAGIKKRKMKENK